MTTEDAPPIAIPDAWREAARAKRLDLAVVARAVELRLPARLIQRWLTQPWSNADYFQRRLEWHERLTFGSLRGREATTADNDAFSDLWANAPEDIGEWDVTTERAPNAFAQFRLQENVNLLVIEDAGVLVASCAFSTRNVIVGGQRLRVSYGQALRVRSEYRRQGYGDQVRSISWGVGAGRPSHTQYDYMRSQNFAVVNWWTKYSPGFFDNTPEREGDVPGLSVTVLQYPRRPFDGDASGIRKVRPRDLARCVGLINRTHRGHDFFRPYSIEYLRYRLDDGFWGERPDFWDWPAVYGWPDYYVLEDGGRAVACAGLWDRGRDVRDRWRHKTTGEEHVVAPTSVLDFGFERGREDAMARLIAYLIGETDRLGRACLTIPLDRFPALAQRLEKYEPVPDTRRLRWGLTEPEIKRPYTDLSYW